MGCHSHLYWSVLAMKYSEVWTILSFLTPRHTNHLEEGSAEPRVDGVEEIKRKWSIATDSHYSAPVICYLC